MRFSLFLLIVISLSGCGTVGFPGAYKINIEQGNIVTQELVDQLKPGMSRRQVRFIMGTPLIEDTFNQDRWDYTYITRNGLTIISEEQLTVYFDGDSLAKISGTMTPGGGEEAPEESI
jgi:outer membrane protein assembly factor BamE